MMYLYQVGILDSLCLLIICTSMSGPQAINRPTIAFALQCCNSSSISNCSIEISPSEFAKTDISFNSVKTKYNFINQNIVYVGSYT